MQRIIFILLIIGCCSGCTKLKYLDELFTLKRVADDQAHFDEVVEEADRRFEQLVKAVQQGAIENYPDKLSILEEFGEPVNVNRKTRDDLEMEFWYYRQSVKFFDSDSVYLYFDEAGNLREWEYFEAEPSKE